MTSQDNANHSMVHCIALKNALVRRDIFIYTGRDAFGLRRTTFPVNGMARLAETWLVNDRNDF